MLTNSLANISCVLSLLVSNLRPFSQVSSTIAHTQINQDAPPTLEVKPIKCNDLVKFYTKVVLWGWLLESTYSISSGLGVYKM